MKKFIFLIIFLISYGFSAMAQDGWYLKLRAVDALGTSDTIIIQYKEGATDGFDPELGEVNLYGIAPEKDIDLRIIQRADTNYWVKHDSVYLNSYLAMSEELITKGIAPFWMVPFTDVNKGDTLLTSRWFFNGPNGPHGPMWTGSICSAFPTAKENADLKVNYVEHNVCCWNYALKLHAKHFPVNLYLCGTSGKFNIVFLETTGFYSYKGQYLGSLWAFPNYIEGNFYFNPINISEYISGDNLLPLLTVLDSASASDCLIELHTEVLLGILIPESSKLLYPNPTNNYVVLDDVSINNKMILLDATGKIIKNFLTIEVPFILDISMLPVGHYYIINQTISEYYSFIKL